MPSKEVYQKLITEGIRVDKSFYDTYDTLEQREDLEFLFNSLVNYRDIRGNHPIFTFNTVMGNPAFDRIKEDNFENYYHQFFFTSYKEYNQDNIADLWHKAIKENLIQPQFHAKEHLNVSLWMEALRKKHAETSIAFNHRFYGLKTNTPSFNQNNYLAAYWAENELEFDQKNNILREGVEIFRRTFDYKPESFVACNFIYPLEMEKTLSDLGIKYIQTQRGHISPDIFTGNKKIKRHFTGQVNKINQIYTVRNCFFEPTLHQNKDSVNHCLKEIKTAFRWKKPAVISSHRINYVGGLSTQNRDYNLNKLGELLNLILKKWPEVEFFSSAKLGSVIKEVYENSYPS